MAARYEHTFDFCFTIKSAEPAPELLTADDLLGSLLARINTLAPDEILEACGWVDTIEILPNGQGIRNPER